MKVSFPWLALGLGILLGAVVMAGGGLSPDGATTLPLLTLLIVTEFGFFVTAIGAGMGIRRLLGGRFELALLLVVLGCSVMTVVFLWLGLTLWPGGFPG